MKKSLRIFLLILAFLAIVLSVNIQPNRDLLDLKTKYANSESEFLELDGMPVHYRDEGQGFPIVLVHGTGASLHTWEAWTDDLERDYRVIRMDLPAFGLTGPHPGRDYTLDAYVSFLDGFVEKLNLESFHLAGNSLGGNIAWLYAARHPDKVAKLVLLDPGGYHPGSGRKSPGAIGLAKTPVLNQLIKIITPRSLVEDNLLSVYHDDSKVTEELIDQYFELTLRPGNRQAFIDRAKTPAVDHTDELKNIEAPTLIIWGAEDTWIDPDHAGFFLEAIPQAKLEMMKEVGHIPMEEAPEASVQILRKFLAGNSRVQIRVNK